MQPRRPTTRSQTTAAAVIRSPAQTGRLFRLPDELLVAIGRLLEVDHLADFVDEVGDLERFATTCLRIRAATSGLRAMTLKVRIAPSTHASTNPFSAAIRKLAFSHVERAVVRRLVVQDDSGYHSDSPEQAVVSRLVRWYAALAAAIRRLHRLEVFRYSTDISVATSASPYLVQPLHADVVDALAELTGLESLFLAGLRLSSRSDLRRHSDVVLPNFNSELQNLSLVAVNDSMLSLARSCPSATSLRIWRDFCSESRPLPSWFPGWSTVRIVQWRGFAGGDSQVLQSSVGPCRLAADQLSHPVPLTSLTLEDAMTAEEALALLRPFASLGLTTLSLVLWRDRHFTPSVMQTLAGFFPRLAHLRLILERFDIKWWPYPTRAWASDMGHFESLKTFCWNHTPYPDYALETIRPHLQAEAMHIARAVTSLETLRFVGSDEQELKFVRCQGGIVGFWQDDSSGSPETETSARDAGDSNASLNDIFESTFVRSGGATQGESTLAKLTQARLEHQHGVRKGHSGAHPPNRPSSVLANRTNRGTPAWPRLADDVLNPL